MRARRAGVARRSQSRACIAFSARTALMLASCSSGHKKGRFAYGKDDNSADSLRYDSFDPDIQELRRPAAVWTRRRL